jgi:hypothetical protein
MYFVTLMLEGEHMLRLGMLVLVKCIHDFYSLLGHIIIYLLGY